MRGLCAGRYYGRLIHLLGGRDREIVSGSAQPANRIVDEELIFLQGMENTKHYKCIVLGTDNERLVVGFGIVRLHALEDKDIRHRLRRVDRA